MRLLFCLLLASCGDPPVPYAWDRAERVDAPLVAVYTATVSLRDGDVVWRPRAHPLTLRPGARRIAVIHVEPAAPSTRRTLDDALVAFLVGKIGVVAQQKDVVEVQLDYEAPVSERAFLRKLVAGLRPVIKVRLSMTALASWCLFDDWIADLPVDEAVPMVYRMGRDREPVRRWLDDGKDFREPLCRHSVAVSLADPPPKLPSGRRRFVFNPHSWNDPL